MRTTVTIDDAVIIAAKKLAQARSCSLGAAISELIRRGLAQEFAIPQEEDFPVFQVPPGAPVITLEDVKQMEDEL